MENDTKDDVATNGQSLLAKMTPVNQVAYVTCPKHGIHIHAIIATIKGHEGAWCQICWLESLGPSLPTEMLPYSSETLDLPITSDKKLRSLEEHNADRAAIYAESSLPHKNGIACPKCGEETVDCGTTLLLTNPPKKSICCPSCQWTGVCFA